MPADSFPQRFGPYVLLRMLGAGGMGDVYLALTGKPGMERPCVVKRLAQHSTSEEGERFRREANLARKLSHGAIAQTLARRPPPVTDAIPPPSKLNPDVPGEIDAVVLRAISRDPNARFRDVDQILKALGAHLPPDFSGGTEVAGFLQKHYDVARERD